MKIIPKSGPFKSLVFKDPTPEVEKMFMASFNATIDSYRALLANVDAGRMELRNQNFDVGEPTPAGKYAGTDQAYDKLLGKLASHKFNGISPELRANMLDYYKDRKPPASPATKKASAEWAKLMEQLEMLDQIPAEVSERGITRQDLTARIGASVHK